MKECVSSTMFPVFSIVPKEAVQNLYAIQSYRACQAENTAPTDNFRPRNITYGH